MKPLRTRKSKRQEKHRGWPFGNSLSPVYGESSLWAAVITQAMMDALSKSRHAEAVHHQHEAIRWLMGNSRDFITVCLMAGYDPDYIRRKAKKAIANPKPWRAEPGKGRRYHERRSKRQQQSGMALPCPPASHSSSMTAHIHIIQQTEYR